MINRSLLRRALETRLNPKFGAMRLMYLVLQVVTYSERLYVAQHLLRSTPKIYELIHEDTHTTTRDYTWCRPALSWNHIVGVVLLIQQGFSLALQRCASPIGRCGRLLWAVKPGLPPLLNTLFHRHLYNAVREIVKFQNLGYHNLFTIFRQRLVRKDTSDHCSRVEPVPHIPRQVLLDLGLLAHVQSRHNRKLDLLFGFVLLSVIVASLVLGERIVSG